MSKSIYILYSLHDKTCASKLSDILTGSGYTVSLVPYEQTKTSDFLSTLSPDNCQLIISINMVGFESVSSDGGVTFNKTPINILAYILDESPIYDHYLSHRINYTTHIIVQSQEYKAHITKQHPHVRQVDLVKSINDLPNFLSNMDWRF